MTETPRLAHNERIVRHPNGHLMVECVPPPSQEDIDAKFASLAKAWPVLAKHADHIDGEFDLALSGLRRIVARLQGYVTAPSDDTARLDWWFARGLNDSVCDGSVDLWWADEQDGDSVERVTHGTSVRDALDKAMRGVYDA